MACGGCAKHLKKYKVENQEEEDKDDNYKPDNKSIYEEENFYYSYQESYNKAIAVMNAVKESQNIV